MANVVVLLFPFRLCYLLNLYFRPEVSSTLDDGGTVVTGISGRLSSLLRLSASNPPAIPCHRACSCMEHIAYAVIRTNPKFLWSLPDWPIIDIPVSAAGGQTKGQCQYFVVRIEFTTIERRVRTRLALRAPYSLILSFPVPMCRLHVRRRASLFDMPFFGSPLTAGSRPCLNPSRCLCRWLDPLTGSPFGPCHNSPCIM